MVMEWVGVWRGLQVSLITPGCNQSLLTNADKSHGNMHMISPGYLGQKRGVWETEYADYGRIISVCLSIYLCL